MSDNKGVTYKFNISNEGGFDIIIKSLACNHDLNLRAPTENDLLKSCKAQQTPNSAILFRGFMEKSLNGRWSCNNPSCYLFNLNVPKFSQLFKQVWKVRTREVNLFLEELHKLVKSRHIEKRDPFVYHKPKLRKKKKSLQNNKLKFALPQNQLSKNFAKNLVEDYTRSSRKITVIDLIDENTHNKFLQEPANWPETFANENDLTPPNLVNESERESPKLTSFSDFSIVGHDQEYREFLEEFFGPKYLGLSLI